MEGWEDGELFHSHLSTALDVEKALDAPQPISLQQCLFSTLFLPLHFPYAALFFKYASHKHLNNGYQMYNIRGIYSETR